MQYSCEVSSPVNSITWNITCPNEHHGTMYTVRVNDGQMHLLHLCPGFGGDLVTFEIVLTFNLHGVTQSNMTVTVSSINYLINSFKSLRIGCEGAANYSYLKIAGKLLVHSIHTPHCILRRAASYTRLVKYFCMLTLALSLYPLCQYTRPPFSSTEHSSQFLSRM